MFCGRLGNEVMAGYGIASATINVTTAATGYGLGLACDTLVSQTFGGKNLRQVGVILQRSIIILMLFCLPCWGLLINAQAILLCLGQDPEPFVFRIAQLYITAFLPAVPVIFVEFYIKNTFNFNHIFLCLYIQGIILPQMYSAALANLANGLTNYIFLYWLDLGVGGSAAANALSQIYICAFLFAYIRWKKLHVTTWGGWSVESLQEWGSYMKLAIPSTLMKCFEWWVYEFGGFFAGMLSEDELAAQHAVIMALTTDNYLTEHQFRDDQTIPFTILNPQFPLGIQAAACARVGNALGAGDSQLKNCKKKIILIICSLVLGSTKTVIGSIFTSDERIIGLVSHLMNAYFKVYFFFLQCVCTGIFLGAGKQKIPAVANFIGYYCIGLSLSVTLMFVAKLRVLGFWVGLLVCVILQSTFYITVIFRLNWEKVAEEVMYNKSGSCEELFWTEVHGSGSFLSAFLQAVKRAQRTTHVSDSEGTPVDGYMSVSTQCQDGNTEGEGGHVVQQLKDNRLSTTQLIIRRGLTMFAAVALLAVGAIVHFLVPLPESHPAESNYTTDWLNATYTPETVFFTVLVPNEESE
uniref:Multidrug and toxin extrusion protein n=1 Tax=Kryptolebias marmoratus TaxID=37003 RepID=A0A3Q3ATT1_KRYMA